MNTSLRNLALAAIALGAIGSTAFIWARSTSETNSLLEPQNPKVVARGKVVYAANCASCHGVDLEGEPNWRQPKPDLTMPAPPHDETGHTWHHPDRMLFELTKYGLGKLIRNPDYKTSMPNYEGVLSDAEIVAVLSYIKSTWPEDVRRRHDELNRRSAAREK